MNPHLSIEQMSALVDGDGDLPWREHLSQCDKCHGQVSRMKQAAEALSAKPLPVVTTDMHRSLREAVLKSAARKPRFFARPAFAGGLAIVSVLLIVVVAFKARNPPAQIGSKVALDKPAAETLDDVTDFAEGPAKQALVLESFNFEDDASIRQRISALPVVSGARYNAGDVGTKQEAAFPQAAAAQEGRAAQDKGQSPQSIESCSRKVLKTQPYPMIPLIARDATYKSEPAVLLVYAWTSSREANAPLDKAQVWLLDPQRCDELEGDQVLAAVLHYSSFVIKG